MFYYLLAGASEEERKSFHLLKPEEYHYLNQVGALILPHRALGELLTIRMIGLDNVCSSYRTELASGVYGLSVDEDIFFF